MRREGIAARALKARLAKEGRPPTIMELAVMNVGVLRGGEALWGLLMWTLARRKADGAVPDNAALMAMARTTRQSSWRMRTLLAEAFGDEEALGLLADVVEASSTKALDDLLAFEGEDTRSEGIGTAVLLLSSLPAAPGGLS